MNAQQHCEGGEFSGTNLPAASARSTRTPARGKWLFLGAFIFSCFLFWWLRSLLIRMVLRIPDPVDDETIEISMLAASLFIAGYLLPRTRRTESLTSRTLLDACGSFAYWATVVFFPFALIIALNLLSSRLGTEYGVGNAIPRAYQAVLYIHLFFGFMFLGAAEPKTHGERRIWVATLLVTLPRFIISIHGARFFLAQAIVPALLIAVARGWIRFSIKRVLQIAGLALAIILVPAITRGSAIIGPDNGLAIFMDNNVLGLYQDNTDLDLNEKCPPLLVSLTAKTIPYGMLGACVVDFAGLKNMPATLDRILTNNDPTSFHGTAAGSGSVYLLELYLSGGIAAVLLGSALFGFSCRMFVGWLGKRSLFSGIWAECLTRALLAPRGNLGYVYERIPSLVLATLLVIAMVWAGRLLKLEYAVTAAASGERGQGVARELSS